MQLNYLNFTSVVLDYNTFVPCEKLIIYLLIICVPITDLSKPFVPTEVIAATIESIASKFIVKRKKLVKPNKKVLKSK